MPIIIDKTLKRNPLRPEEAPKWHVYSKSLGVITEKEVARQIAKRTALNQKEAEMALFLLREVLIENLMLGYTVSLSDWATFYTTLKSEGTENKKDANGNKVKRVRLHLRHHKSFENELQAATFMSIDNLTKKETETEKPVEDQTEE